MILRLVLSFCFLCFVTGNSWTRKYTNPPQNPPTQGDQDILPCKDGEEDPESLSNPHGQFLRSDGGDEFADNLPYTRASSGEEAPLEHDMFSTDADNVARSKHFKRDMDIITSESKTKVVKIPDIFVNKDSIHTFSLNNKDCYSSISVKRIIIGVLEHVKQNPYEIDMLLQDIRSEIEAESQLFWFKNNMQSDKMKSMFKQFQYGGSKFAEFESYPQCTGAFTQLAETAFSAYSELQKFPLCLQVIFGYQGETVQQTQKETNADLSVIIATILKQMQKYVQPKPEPRPRPRPKQENIEIELPEIEMEQLQVVQPQVIVQPLPEPITEIQEEIVQPQITEEIYEYQTRPEYQTIQEIISIPQPEPETEPPYIQPDVSPQEGPTLPEYFPEPEPAPEPMPAPQPTYTPPQQPQPIYEERPEMVVVPDIYQQEPEIYMQDGYEEEPEIYHISQIVQTEPQVYEQETEIYKPQTEIYKPQPEVYEPQPEVYEPQPEVLEPQPEVYEPQPEVYEPQPEIYHMPEVYEPQSEMYPEVYVEQKEQVYVEPTQELYIEQQQKQPFYYDTKEIYVEPKPFYVEPKPVYVEPTPVYVEPKPVYIEPKPVYVEPKPVYVEPTPVYIEPKPIYVEPTPIYIEPTPEVYSEIIVQDQPDDYVTQATTKSNVVNILLRLVTDTHSTNNIENIVTVLKQNRAVFKPRLYKILFALLNGFRKGTVDTYRFNEMFYFLLQPQKNKIWNDEKKQFLWYLLLPDKEGQVDMTRLDTILSLIHAQDANSIHILDEILPLFKIIKEGRADQRTIEIILTLLNQNKKRILRPDQINILLTLIKPNKKGRILTKYIDIAAPLVHWDQISYLNPEYVNIIFSLLRPNIKGKIDTRATEIIHEILSPKKHNYLTKKDINIIFSFLKSDSGTIESKRLDVVLFILKNMARAPRLIDVLIKLLKDTTVVHSKYIDILLSLQRRRMLSIQLLEGLISLLKQERTGDIDEHDVNNILLLLEPYKTTHPKIVIDIYNQLRPIPASTNINFNLHTIPDNMKVLLYYLMNSGIHQLGDVHLPDIEPLHYIWQGYNQHEDKQSLKLNLLSKILQMLQWEQKREFATESLANNYGFIELTYMLKHQKPLLYHPVYYVKYKIPMVNFLTNVKSLIAQKPQLTADPAKLLQELIIEGNVSEVSPNLKGYRKEDILKLTFKDGDLVQAKVLDEKSLSLNEQIKLMHNLNADVTAEDILQQNEMNAAKFYTTVGSTQVGNVDDLTKVGGFANVGGFTKVNGQMGGLSNVGGLVNLGDLAKLGGIANLGGIPNVGALANMGGLANIESMANMGGVASMGGMASMGGIANIGSAANVGGMAAYGGYGSLDLSNEYDGSLGYAPMYFNQRRDSKKSFLRSSEPETTDTRQYLNGTSQN